MKLFGTDGVRGKAGVYPLDSDTVKKVAFCAGKVLGKGKSHKIIIVGRDTRESGKEILSALKKGFNSLGISVWDLGIITTPGVSFLAKKYPVLAGVVISASHNPYSDNGIKFFSHKGAKLTDSTESKIEDLIKKGDFKSLGSKKVKNYSKSGLVGEYIKYLQGHLLYYILSYLLEEVPRLKLKLVIHIFSLNL